MKKDVKKASDGKFARWKALFNNFDFDIEHIQGTSNSIPDFLSREHLQPHTMVISVRWQNEAEVLVIVPYLLRWEQYKEEWRPHWELRSTQIINPTS